MRRALLLCIALAALTWADYQIWPGHSYTEGETQIYLPMLERLDMPGFLTRDLVATHPTLTYTIYDEVTLFLHEAVHWNFQKALAAQQIVCRAAGIVGVYLIAASAGVGALWALVISALVNLGAFLPGIDVMLLEREPIPRAFAFGLIVLAIGFVATGKPLLAGLSGGVALVYAPATAAVFWAVILLIFIAARQERRMLKPALTILVVFALLLANLVQLQPGIGEQQVLFGRISDSFARLQQYRTPAARVSLWAPRQIWLYLALWVCSVWATARVWALLNRQAKYFFVLFPIVGIFSVVISDLLLEHLRWKIVPQIQPARALLLTVLFALIACAVAGVQAAKARLWIESALWLAVVLALPVNTLLHAKASPNRENILDVADWAEKSTWGSSMFLFPDAGRALYPGVFRVASRRALYVDWISGSLSTFFPELAKEWRERWEQTMAGEFTPEELEGMLQIPVDYFVLRRSHQLAGVKTAYSNTEFVVYDSSDLRNATQPLREASATGSSR